MPKRIAYFRKRADLSQQDLAILCGWSSQTRISNYENETRSPSIEDVAVIAMVLGIDPKVLVFGANSSEDIHAGEANPSPGLIKEPGTLPERIVYYRKLAGLSQKDLALLCGWDVPMRLSNYEKGRRRVSVEDLATIANALGLDPKVLAYGETVSEASDEVGFSSAGTEISISARTITQAKTVLAVDTLLKGAEAGVIDNVLLMELEALALKISSKMKIKSSIASGA
jgi:transcriptional regulator with XRE-family HTH domain